MARRRKSGCGITLLFWIIIFLVLLIILLQMQDNKQKNKNLINRISNIFNNKSNKIKQDKAERLVSIKNLQKKLQNRTNKRYISIDLYFVKYIESLDKLRLVKVTRKIRYTDMVLTKSIEELIAGPTESESRKGISSVMPAGIKLLGINIKNGIAYINFNSAFESGVGVSMLEARLYQVVYTATQFEGIKGVRFLIEGKSKSVFSAEGLSIRKPLTRLSGTPVF